MTNSEHHALAYRRSGWRFAGFRRRCDRYFGPIDGCTGIIQTGAPIFNTAVPRFKGLLSTSAPARRATLTVCEICARAPHIAVATERAA